VPVRVVHSAGRAHLTGFALDVARHALDFFGDYFGIAYPGEKLDLVAIPDFAYGAMENVGCVTFRETALLVDPDAAARVELERVADVVHHEIAHMWFGDLVTMGWWEGIWLNEAFATFMETLATDHFRPSWQRWTTFATERDAALAVDGLHSTRPIEYAVHSPDEADGMFDTLTYEKGGSVLRMIEQYLGPETFRDGVRQYLTTHAYGNTVTTDLWNALEEVSGEPVRAMAETWILHGGHPLVTVSQHELAQEPFSYLPESPSGESAIGSNWLVPLLVRAIHEGDGDGEVHRLLLGDEPLALRAVLPSVGIGLVNAGGWGVYRVAYAPAHLQAIASHLDDLSALERFDLLSDCWALVLAGRAELADLIQLAAQLGEEEDPADFQVVATALDLARRVATDADRPLVEAATRALLGPRAAALGWEPREGEGERLPALRSLLIQALGRTGADAGVRAEASRRFDAARHGSPIDPDIESAVLAVVGDQCGAADYETVLDRFRHPANPQQERRYLLALGSFSDPELCVRSFDLALSEIRSQDGPFLVLALLANHAGGPAVWERVKAEWPVLLDRFPDVTHDRMLSSVRTLCTDPALAADVARFLHDHPLAVGSRSIAQSLERLEVNVRFARRMREDGHLADACRAISGG
ncbi:MAG: M1 family aminopeptidase, partial [Acidimicrobiales bacterium]